MFRLFRGPLLEEAGAAEGGGAAPAAAPEAAQAPPAAADVPQVTGEPSQSILDIIASRKASRTAPEGENAPPAETQEPPAAAQEPAKEPEKPAEGKKLPKVEPPRATSLAERLKLKAAAEAARAQEAQQQNELSKQLELAREEANLSKSASLKFRKAMDEGDFDAALKAIDFQGGVEGFTKSYLERKAGLKVPQEDPRVSELQKRIDEYEARENEREQQRQQREAEEQMTAQYHRDIADLGEEAKASGYTEVAKAAKVDGFLPLAYRLVHQHAAELQAGSLQMDDIWSMTHDAHQQLFTQMVESGAFVVPDRGSNHEAASAASPDRARVQPENSPDRSRVQSAQPARQPPSHLSPANASEPVTQRVATGEQFNDNFRQRREAARQRFIR